MTSNSELLASRHNSETGVAYPLPPDAGWARRLFRRIALRAMKPHTTYQQGVNQQLADAVTGLRAKLDENAERTQMLDGRLRGSASIVRALDARLGELCANQSSLENGLRAVEDVAKAVRYRPEMNGLALAPFHVQPTGRVYGYRQPTTTAASRETVGERLLEIFAGSIADAQARRRVYIELLANSSPVVDIGCGRGEFLDLLRDRGMSYVGVDPDPGMIAATRRRGHTEVVHSDGASYLESLGNESTGAIFCAQVIEHLPADYLIGLIELAHAKLKPGGLLIVEAPNPHSPYIGKIFWLDITHRRPVFPEVMLALCWMLGFESAYVFHPAGSGDADADRFVEPEYAVVATKARGPDGSHQ